MDWMNSINLSDSGTAGIVIGDTTSSKCSLFLCSRPNSNWTRIQREKRGEKKKTWKIPISLTLVLSACSHHFIEIDFINNSKKNTWALFGIFAEQGTLCYIIFIFFSSLHVDLFLFPIENWNSEKRKNRIIKRKHRIEIDKPWRLCMNVASSISSSNFALNWFALNRICYWLVKQTQFIIIELNSSENFLNLKCRARMIY